MVKKTPNARNTPKKRRQPNPVAKYSSMGIKMLLVIGIGVFGGVYLDQQIAWKIPVFTIVLSLASVSLAIYSVIKDLLK